MDSAKKESMFKLLNPRSVAVVGASERSIGYGGRMMNTLITNHYPGRLYPVNPTKSEIFGLKCYPSISALPEAVDLAIIIIKAEMVEDVVKECEVSHVGALLIITAGFSELDKVNGPIIEQHIREMARRANMRTVGPNCMGMANVQFNLWACSNVPGGDVLNPGHIGLVAQSGAAGFGPLLAVSKDRAVGVKYIITTGNEADLGLCDLAEYMLEDPDIRVVAWLIEGIRDGEEFKRVMEKAQQCGKRMVMLKLGESSIGSRAAASHTASLAGDMEVFNALLRHYGVVKAESYEELIEIANILQNDRQLRGNRIAMISHSGGISGFGGDQLGKYGFDVPVFSAQTQERIDIYLKGFGSPKNPVDLTGQMRSPNIVDIMTTIEQNEKIDAFVVATHGNLGNSENGLCNVIEACEKVSKPIFYSWTGSLYHSGLDTMRKSGLPLSFCLRKLASNIKKVYDTKFIVDEIHPSSIRISGASSASGYLNEADGKAVIEQAGVKTPKRYIVKTLKEVDALSPEKVYAAKVLSDVIIHKSDIAGVKLNITGTDRLRQAFNELITLGDGVLVEEMCDDGLDMILGLRADSQYGPIVMAGMGGIYTELYKLVSLRPIPIGRKQTECLLDEIPGLDKLLAGFRGQKAYDREGLVDIIVKLSGLFAANQDCLELIEINPLRVMPENGGAYALDCVIKKKGG